MKKAGTKSNYIGSMERGGGSKHLEWKGNKEKVAGE